MYHGTSATQYVIIPQSRHSETTITGPQIHSAALALGIALQEPSSGGSAANMSSELEGYKSGYSDREPGFNHRYVPASWWEWVPWVPRSHPCVASLTDHFFGSKKRTTDSRRVGKFEAQNAPNRDRLRGPAPVAEIQLLGQ